MFKELIQILTHPATIPMLLFALLVIWVYCTLTLVASKRRPLNPRFSDSKSLNALGWIGLLLSPFGTIVFIVALWDLLVLAWSYPSLDAEASIIRYHSSLMLANLAAIGALFTLLFAFVRVFTTERQTLALEEQSRHNDLVLLNTRVQSALELMSARTVESRIGRNVSYLDGAARQHMLQWHDEDPRIDENWSELEVGDWQVFERSQPDIQVRQSGIEQLDAIAMEHPSRRGSVNTILASYIRQNSPAKLASVKKYSDAPQSGTPRELKAWENGVGFWGESLILPVDIQSAIASIGKSSTRDHTNQVDLGKVNLQGAKLVGAYLQGVNLEGSILSGSDLRDADLVGASLTGTDLSCASLRNTELEATRLVRTVFFFSELSGANLTRCQFLSCDLRYARFSSARMEDARFDKGMFEKSRFVRTDLRRSKFENCIIKGAIFSGSDMSECRIAQVRFIDCTLQSLKLRGSFWRETRVGDQSTFSKSDISGSGFSEFHFRGTPISEVNVADAFVGDGEGLNCDVQKPTRRRGWNSNDMEPESSFERAWRTWQKEIGFDPHDPTTWDGA